MASSPGPSHSRLRRLSSLLRNTPLHPQWLMPPQQPSEDLRACSGLVLDIGAADRWLRTALHPGAEYVALDYPATAVGLYGLRPDVFADARHLPFADNSIDAIACFEVLEHVRDPQAVLSEVARVLVPGGIVNLSMPFLYPVHDAPYDFQRWTLYGWQRSLTDAGLRVEHAHATCHPLHAAAILASLALAGPLQAARGWRRIVGLFVVALLVPVLNIGAWLLSFVWPRWDAMTTGHHVLARKPA